MFVSACRRRRRLRHRCVNVFVNVCSLTISFAHQSKEKEQKLAALELLRQNDRKKGGLRESTRERQRDAWQQKYNQVRQQLDEVEPKEQLYYRSWQKQKGCRKNWIRYTRA